MAEGKIKWFDPQKRYGRIARQGGGEIFIHINQWRGQGVPQEGQAVTFEEGIGPNGKTEAQNVTPIGAAQIAATERPTRREVSRSSRGESYPHGYRFLNPYNFVRPLPHPEDCQEPLLDRCPPPPHDRYVGFSGRIACELTTVTPLFVGDSEEAQKDENNHVSLRFFDLAGHSTIPGTSLRGSIRNVFEAATNSCFNIFDGRRRLSYHLEAHKSPQLVPGRIEKAGEKWQLRLLTGTTPLQVGRLPYGRQYAAWLYAFYPVEPSGTLRKNDPNDHESDFQRRRVKGGGINLHGMKHGAECYALLEEVTHPFPRIKFWDVRAIRPVSEKDKLPHPKRSQRVEKGYLCLTNQNIERKHSERFFFRADDNTTGPLTVSVNSKVIQQYEDLINDYQERHVDEVKKTPPEWQTP